MSRPLFSGHMLRTHEGLSAVLSANKKGEKFAWNYNDEDMLDYGNFVLTVSVFTRRARTFENLDVFYT